MKYKKISNQKRIIRFRIFDTQLRHWHFGFSHAFLSKSFELLDRGIKTQIQQFTGILDKNKTEIYEGDIIKTNKEFVGEYIAEVLFERSCFIAWNSNLLKNMEGLPYLYLFENKNCEIIGNIYENPELLKPSTP